jgi:hypothetical protein
MPYINTWLKGEYYSYTETYIKEHGMNQIIEL